MYLSASVQFNSIALRKAKIAYNLVFLGAIGLIYFLSHARYTTYKDFLEKISRE